MKLIPRQSDDGPPVTAEIMDKTPETICKPLCLVNGVAYAASWPTLKRTIRKTTDAKTKKTETHEPKEVPMVGTVALAVTW